MNRQRGVRWAAPVTEHHPGPFDRDLTEGSGRNFLIRIIDDANFEVLDRSADAAEFMPKVVVIGSKR